MKLSRTSLEKLIRENISENPAPRLQTEEIDTVLAELRGQLLETAGVKEDSGRYFSQDKEISRIQHFIIKEAGDTDHYYWDTYSFSIGINPDNVLCVRLAHDWQPLADSAELFNFIRAYQAGLQRRRAKANKQQKLRDLKAQAIIAQVKNLAKEESFDFYTQTDSVKLKLYIKLSDTQAIEMQIPFSKFQTLLPNIRTAVQALRTVHQAGIRFKIGSARYPWIRHQDL